VACGIVGNRRLLWPLELAGSHRGDRPCAQRRDRGRECGAIGSSAHQHALICRTQGTGRLTPMGARLARPGSTRPATATGAH